MKEKGGLYGNLKTIAVEKWQIIRTSEIMSVECRSDAEDHIGWSVTSKLEIRKG